VDDGSSLKGRQGNGRDEPRSPWRRAPGAATARTVSTNTVPLVDELEHVQHPQPGDLSSDTTTTNKKLKT
jgi:hypothetical protein